MQTTEAAPDRLRRAWALPARRFVPPLIALGACALLLLVAQNLSQSFDYHSVKHALRSLDTGVILQALAATVISYLALIGRDAVALRSIGARVPRSTLVVGATAGSALGNAVGSAP